MRVLLLIAVAALVLMAVGQVSSAVALERLGCRHAAWYPWHGGFYNVSWGMPVALVVPPTAEVQTNWGWGVGNTRISPICHQFHRNWPGNGYYNHKMFQPTPRWPSDTDQFGVYYVRGPW
jgi:hypothetical protein